MSIEKLSRFNRQQLLDDLSWEKRGMARLDIFCRPADFRSGVG